MDSKFVDTTWHCVDTTSNCCRTCFWDSELVSTHRWTVSTPLADCVDTQADCVDTTGYCFSIGFWDSELVLTHRWFENHSSDSYIHLSHSEAPLLKRVQLTPEHNDSKHP
ncbi:hypothetical protein Taro_029388 [Colocasia esculenta]|uniref:Uncharacterized protein n=1 Tax=Colocasia esculenta TaxID=4460 RepID=A0A843VNW9_COLES|nr:hypothetical protein [Colocasia esculenta]